MRVQVSLISAYTKALFFFLHNGAVLCAHLIGSLFLYTFVGSVCVQIVKGCLFAPPHA